MENRMGIIADSLVTFREEKERLEQKLKDINTAIKQTEEALVLEMKEEGTNRFDRNGWDFNRQDKLRASVRADNKEDFLCWMKRSEYRDLVKIQESVHPQSLQAWVRERKKAGDLPPAIESMLNIFIQETVAIKKAK